MNTGNADALGGSLDGRDDRERPTVDGAEYPYGRCECSDCAPCGGRGPAAWSVTRAGRRMRVCTRCWFGTDDDRVPLLTKTDNAKPFIEWDALGAFHIAGALEGDA